jgi:hypothetical protein
MGHAGRDRMASEQGGCSDTMLALMGDDESVVPEALWASGAADQLAPPSSRRGGSTCLGSGR